MRTQRTLRREVSCTGIGLHGGKRVSMRLRPAPVGSGVVIRRTDVEGFEVRNHVGAVCDVDHATSVHSNGHRVGTIEHLLSALNGLGIDNALVEVDSDEIPVLDGSAVPFVYLIHEAGIRVQPWPRRYLRVRRPVEVSSGDSTLSLLPHHGFRVSYTIEFDHRAIRTQSLTLDLTPQVYQDELAPARTFGFLRDVEAMRRAGLARGGSLENAVLLGEHEVLNPLRFPDEFVRHKMLDLVGDFALAGGPILAHAVAHKAGHALHVAAVRQMLSEPDAVEVVTWGEERGVAPVPAPALRAARAGA
jgi:UDP-3-O-[3-hydroxymyristoyl] N-acetylglucosamine deacetylase